jgi:Cu(I)/Ag(I) efflux system membrane protein CusA/SilA
MEKLRIGNTKEISEESRVKIIEKSARGIGRAVFFSILVTLISFAPIFFLSGQEKKLFAPLVLTKTFCMIGSAIVALFILPMLMRVFIKGKLIPESRNPVSKFFIKGAGPIVKFCLKWKKMTALIVLIFVAISIPVVLNTSRCLLFRSKKNTANTG